MSVKDALLSKLSYTKQDYESILLEIAELFNGSSLGTSWDNISESDIMFITMSLLAAHKDMLNYMIDYRTLESFMSTAREFRSVVRNANSFGYKVESYKAGSALVEVSNEVSGVTIPSFTQLIDSSGVAWTYIGDDVEVSTGDQIRVYQGIPRSLDLDIASMTGTPKTHIISNSSVAIGSNYSDAGCSKLTVSKPDEDDSEWEEIENIHTYTDSDNRVYELRIDSQQITYIMFTENFDPADYDGYTFTINYLVTSGSSASSINNLTTTVVSGTSPVSVSFEPVADTLVVGSNPPTVAEIKERFKRYYLSMNSLVTVDDYKNFVMNQKTVLGISKCLVTDNQRDTNGEEGLPALGDGNVYIYVLKDGNALLEAGEKEELDDLVLSRKISGITVEFQDPTEVPVGLKFNILPDDVDGFKSLISDYINSKDIGESVTTTEIYSLVQGSSYASVFRNGISVVFYDVATTTPSENVFDVAINEYLTSDVDEIILDT
jgi:hypothetical protein